jgi:Zn finger protein HypA/HybF involved in hydrogenase expression
MKKLAVATALLALLGGVLVSVVAQDKPAAGAAPAAAAASAPAQPAVCFESRKGASEVTQKEVQPGLMNVRCSPVTGAALWYGDPFDGTVPMGTVPLVDKATSGEAVVKPRTAAMKFYAQCGTACHNGTFPKGFPTTKTPVPLPTMEAMVPDVKNLQHGRGKLWCLDCHHNTKRNQFVDHFGEPISMDQPQLLCGKCHGDKLRDWRDGIHGKRIGEFTSTGKKRWFTCPECHNPHNVQDGDRNRGFAQLQPETPPQLPRGMKDGSHEKVHPIPLH